MLTAENSKNSLFRVLAIILAKVVLPDPGGPQKMREGKKSLLLRSFFIIPLFLPNLPAQQNLLMFWVLEVLVEEHLSLRAL